MRSLSLIRKFSFVSKCRLFSVNVLYPSKVLCEIEQDFGKLVNRSANCISTVKCTVPVKKSSGNRGKENTSNTGISELLNTVSQIISSDDFNQVVFHPVFSNIMNELQNFNDDEMLQLGLLLRQIKVKFGDVLFDDDEIIRALTLAIDKEVCKRYVSFDEDRLVEFMSVVVHFPRQHYSFFIEILKTRLRKALKWPTPKMLQFIKLLNNAKVWHVYYVNKYSLEFATARRLPFLSLHELGILIDVMNKVNININTPNLFQDIFNKFVQEFPSITHTTYEKFILFFTNHVYNLTRDDNKITQLLQLVNENLDSLPLRAVIDTADLFTKLNCYDNSFFAKFASRLIEENISELSGKRIISAVHALTYFGVLFDSTVPYYELLLKLKTELLDLPKNKPKVLISILYHLSRINVYDYELLDMVFSKGFLIDTYKKLDTFHVPLEMYSLNESVHIDCPDYQGRKLPQMLKQAFVKFCNNRSIPQPFSIRSSDNETDKYVFDDNHKKRIFNIWQILISLFGGSQYAHVCYPLPHINRLNLIFCMKDRVPQKTEVKLPHLSENPDKKFMWYSFIFMVSNSKPDIDEALLVYNGIMEKRHLEKLGYCLLPIVIDRWNSMNENERRNELEKRIFES